MSNPERSKDTAVNQPPDFEFLSQASRLLPPELRRLENRSHYTFVDLGEVVAAVVLSYKIDLEQGVYPLSEDGHELLKQSCRNVVHWRQRPNAHKSAVALPHLLEFSARFYEEQSQALDEQRVHGLATEWEKLDQRFSVVSENMKNLGIVRAL